MYLGAHVNWGQYEPRGQTCSCFVQTGVSSLQGLGTQGSGAAFFLFWCLWVFLIRICNMYDSIDEQKLRPAKPTTDSKKKSNSNF